MGNKMPEKRSWKRTNYFIKKDLQGKYMLGNFIFGVAGLLIFLLIFSYLTHNTLNIADDCSVYIGSTPMDLFGRLVSTYWIFILLGGLAGVVISMFFSHRLAGPLFRFERTVEEMLKGNFSITIRLRKKDEGKELAAMINKFNERFSGDVDRLRAITNDMDNNIASALQAFEDDEQARQKRNFALKQAMASSSSLREILYGFKTKKDV